MGKKFRHKKVGSSEPPSSAAVREGEVDQSLSAIFRDETTGEMPDLTKLDRRRSRWIIYLFAGVSGFLLLLLSAVWAGFMVFKPFRGFSGQGLELNIDGPSRIVLGQETSFFINYSNTANEPLASAEVRVSFPADFAVTSVEPDPTSQGMTWRLGSVGYGDRGTFTIKGVFTGALGTMTAIQAVGNYRPSSFNSDFEALAAKQIEYAESVLGGAITVPDKALPGDKVKIAYAITNQGTSVMRGLEARVVLPPGFVRETSSTTDILDGNTVRFPLSDLSPGTSSTVLVVGSFNSGAGGELPIHAETGSLGSNGIFLPAQKSDAKISVLAGDLTLKLLANGTSEDRTVSFGDSLRFALEYENTSGEELQGITLRLRLEPLAVSSTGGVKNPSPVANRFVDWSGLEETSSGTVLGDTLTWGKDQIGALGRMPVGADGGLEFSVPVISAAQAISGVSGFQAVIEATVEKVGDAALNRTVRTHPLIFKYRTDADLLAEARYYTEEGAPQGSGPLPPVVGQTTTYRINWAVSKSRHELKDMRVSAVLPSGVSWPKNAMVSAGVIAYDEESREVRWELNKMPEDVAMVSAEFDVAYTPVASDVGRFAQLLGEIRFQAYDLQIDETVNLVKLGLTTDLQNDENAKGKGVVRKP